MRAAQSIEEQTGGGPAGDAAPIDSHCGTATVSRVLDGELDARDLGFVLLFGVAELAAGEPECAERYQDDGDDATLLLFMACCLLRDAVRRA